MITRRHLFGLGGLAAGGLLLPRPARAASASDRKFIFVFAQGGWDPTRVLATPFDNSAVSMEAAAERATAGGISYVDHEDRPSVRSFFQANHSRSVVLNGVLVRSIAHEICQMITMTGTTSGLTPDWPAVIADSQRDRYLLPHLVLGGPSFPGNLGAAVARTGQNGQLEALISGDALSMTDVPVGLPRSPSESVIDRYLVRRAQARAAGAGKGLDAALSADFETAATYLQQLKDLQWTMDFTGGADLADQAAVACDALSQGVSRCVTLSAASGALGWDTHANNDNDQSVLWEGLFSGLLQLAGLLDTTPGEVSATLAEETVVVVLSEMGRTPALNAFNGKDHWPYTSVLLFGAGLDGDRVIGNFDENFYGELVDTVSGDVSDSGAVLSAETVGATLLALADIDPAEHVSGVDPLAGIVA